MDKMDLYSVADEKIAVLRDRYLTICNGDRCTAFLLDKLYATHSYIYKNPVELAHELFDLFTPTEVLEACMTLFTWGYIEAGLADTANVRREERYIAILCNHEAIENDLRPYYNLSLFQKPTYPEEDEEDEDEDEDEGDYEEEIEDGEEEIEEVHQPPIYTPQPRTPVLKPTPEEVRAKNIEEEVKRIRSHNKRAFKVGLPGTLTIDQWVSTLDHFNWRCAYCQRDVYYILEHFVPLTHGVGTTYTNCVPACCKCNSTKQSWNPLSLNRPKMPDMEAGFIVVQQYFETLVVQEKQDEAG